MATMLPDLFDDVGESGEVRLAAAIVNAAIRDAQLLNVTGQNARAAISAGLLDEWVRVVYPDEGAYRDACAAIRRAVRVAEESD
jgi:hypothetical protein